MNKRQRCRCQRVLILSGLRDLLISRYTNPSLSHRTWQIAMDGSQKLPQRLLDSVRWHLADKSAAFLPC
ncbi:hypothetical protein ACLK1Y_24320 [Escherichia coli]